MNLLFDIEDSAIPHIDGLSYVKNFITESEEKRLTNMIDTQPWLNDLKRRVQHYGYKYDYKARSITKNSYLGELPDWLSVFTNRLSFTPDQAIVNEYEPGQGISPHIDCTPCFDDTIASLSLESAATMQFTNGNDKQEIYLQPRSLIMLSGSARYKWQHAIPARKSDVVSGFKILRERRISITFRKTII